MQWIGRRAVVLVSPFVLDGLRNGLRAGPQLSELSELSHLPNSRGGVYRGGGYSTARINAASTMAISVVSMRRADGDRYDVRREGWYRSGDRGYTGRYGSRDDYRQVYRDGFTRGYDQGYREAATTTGIGAGNERGLTAGGETAESARRACAARGDPAGGGGRRARLVEPDASVHHDGADVLDEARPLERDFAKPLGRNLEHPHIVDRAHRRGARIAGQHRHLAEEAAGLDHRDFLSGRLEHDARAAARARRTSNCPASPCRTIASPAAKMCSCAACARARARDPGGSVEKRSMAPSRAAAEMTSPSERSGSSSREYSIWIGYGISILRRRNVYQMLLRT